MGRGGEGGGAADVAGDGEDAAPLIEFAGVEEFAAETVPRWERRSASGWRKPVSTSA